MEDDTFSWGANRALQRLLQALSYRTGELTVESKVGINSQKKKAKMVKKKEVILVRHFSKRTQ